MSQSSEQKTKRPSRETTPSQGFRRRDLPDFQSLWTSLQRVGFWAAVMIPFLYIPLLFTGIETLSEVVVFVVLIALNAVSLVVGHPHHN
jgi:hypothetical protein